MIKDEAEEVDQASKVGSPMVPASRANPTIALITCGALSVDVRAIIERNSWRVDVHPLPPLQHNRPERIAQAVDQLVTELEGRYERISVGYADCGTYGALDEVCERRGISRLAGSHCYDLYAGSETIAQLSREEPRTYFLTDFLVLGFDRVVWRELGLDRYPDLRDDYFGNYRQVVWLAAKRTPDLERAAERVAERLNLTLQIREVPGQGGNLELSLANLLASRA
jgi:hypothetical protein